MRQRSSRSIVRAPRQECSIRAAQNLALSIAGVVLGCLIGELGLRLAAIEYPPFTRLDERLGTSLRPGASGWFRDEGRAYLRVNSDGMLDREHSVAKPAQSFRIAFLGDSYTEAKQVEREQTFPAVVERRLATCAALAGRTVEALNFGVAGYSTAQELVILRERVWKYAPDLVVLAFYPANDVRENSRALAPSKLRPFFYFVGDRLALDDSFRQLDVYRRHQTRLWQAGRRAIIHSRLLQVLNRARQQFGELRSRPPGATWGRPPSEEWIQSLQYEAYQEPSAPEWLEAWRVTEALLELVARETEAHSARLLIASISDGIQVYPDPEVRRRFLERFQRPDFFYSEDRLKRLGERSGIRVLRLGRPLQEYADQHRVTLHGFPNLMLGDGHYNAEAHRIVGGLIADEICDAGLAGR
jgi:hypothetical protein